MIIRLISRVSKALRDNNQEESENFKKGVETAIAMFNIAIRKSDDYNKNILINDLEKQIHNDKKEIAHLNNLLYKSKQKLTKEVLGSSEPLPYYIPYHIIDDLGTFVIATNMDKDMLNLCVISFKLLIKYEKLDECKQKLIMYINNQQVKGFKAYKSIGSAMHTGGLTKEYYERGKR